MLARLDTLIAFAVLMLGISLIVMILTQTVSAFFGLRGTNLLWGTRMLLKTIDPGLESQAEAILTHPIISDSVASRMFAPFRGVPLIGWLVRRWTLASAIRPEELARMLSLRSQELRNTGDKAGIALADRIDSALGSTDPETARRIRMLNMAFHELAPNYALQIEKSLDQTTTASQQAIGKLEAWFTTAMDRVSQRFTTQMRIWTVIFSFAVALAAQLDAFRLLNQLWLDPQARESLVNSSGAMLREAGAIMQARAGGQITPAPTSDPQIYVAAFEKLKAEHPAATSGLPEMPPQASYADAKGWLAKHLAGRADSDAILQEYSKLAAAALTDKANAIRRQVESSGLQLIPSPYRFLHFDDLTNFLGAAVSAVLLSLGAPFWFNALKSLTNLRPALANKQGQETS